MSLIEVEHVTKEFKVPKKEAAGVVQKVRNFFSPSSTIVKALDDVTFHADEGEVIAYLGPNGAGKSTTVKLMTGILTPTSGEVRVAGYIPYRQRHQCSRHFGVVFGQRSLLWFHIPPIESLKLYRDIYELKEGPFRNQLKLLTDLLGLEDLLHIPVRKLSLGQRMRCELAAALIHQPEILFLDEPTIGLDVVVKKRLREFILELNKQKKTTVVLSSHDLLDVEEICRRAIIIDKGKIVFDGLLGGLMSIHASSKKVRVEYQKVVDEALFRSVLDRGEVLEKTENLLVLQVPSSKAPISDIVQDIMNSCKVIDISVRDPSLETILRQIYEEGDKP